MNPFSPVGGSPDMGRPDQSSGGDDAVVSESLVAEPPAPSTNPFARASAADSSPTAARSAAPRTPSPEPPSGRNAPVEEEVPSVPVRGADDGRPPSSLNPFASDRGSRSSNPFALGNSGVPTSTAARLGAGDDGDNVGLPRETVRPIDDGHSGIPPESAARDGAASSAREPPVPASDEEIIASLPEQMFLQDGVSDRDLLTALPDDFTDDLLAAKALEYGRARDAVNTTLAARIMANYTLFVAGMSKIHELGLDLQHAVVMCKNSRRSVVEARDSLSAQGLVVQALHRKRQMYAALADDLGEVAALRQAEQQLQLALEEGDFPLAIELCLECRASLQVYGSLAALRQFDDLIRDALASLQDRLDRALRDCTRVFDQRQFSRVLLACELLGRPALAVPDALQRCFFDLVDSHAKNALYAHVLLSESNAHRAEHLKSLPFRELAASLEEPHFVDCLCTILEYLVDVLIAHRSMTEWLGARKPTPALDDGGEAGEIGAQEPDGGSSAGRPLTTEPPSCASKSFRRATNEGLRRFEEPLWDKMQRKVASLLTASSRLASFKIDEFLRVLDAVYRFVSVGERFGGGSADHLRRAVHKISSVYFEVMHASRMEELAAYLGHEMWQSPALAPSFRIENGVREFRELLAVDPDDLLANAISVPGPGRVADAPTDAAPPKSPDRGAFLPVFAESGNPFSRVNRERSAQEAADAKREEAEAAAEAAASAAAKAQAAAAAAAEGKLRAKTAAAQPLSPASPAAAVAGSEPEVLLTPTCLDVARCVGKYMQMMRTLPPIAWQVFGGLQQLFNYYLYAVHAFFGAPVTPPACFADYAALASSESALSPELRATLEATRATTQLPECSPEANLHDANGLYGLAARVVATESLRHLAHALFAVQRHLEALVPASKRDQVALFYARSVAVVPELGRHVCVLLSTQVLPYETILTQVTAVNWSTSKSVGTAHNSYVDRLIEEFRLFAVRLGAAGVPPAIASLMWRETIARAMDCLLEGYSRAKKCSDEGQLMRKLDFMELCNGLRSLVAIRPLPREDAVGKFIRAFYSEPDMFLPWIKENVAELTCRQAISVINQGFGKKMKKKLRQELVAAVQEIYGVRSSAAPAGGDD